MKTFKNIVFLGLVALLVALFIADLGAVVHSLWFAFTHIHLTRGESFFHPDNYMGWKLLCLGATWVDGMILTKIDWK